MSRRIVVRAILTVLLLAGTGGVHGLQAQTAEKLIGEMENHFRGWVENMNDVTTLSTMDGDVAPYDSVLTYVEKIPSEGLPQFNTRSLQIGDMRAQFQQEQKQQDVGRIPDYFSLYREVIYLLRSNGEYVREDTVDGEQMHVLGARDASSFFESLATQMVGRNVKGTSITADDIRIYLDPETFVIRRIAADVRIDRGDRFRTVEWSATLRDYQRVNDVPYPRRIDMRVDNLLTEKDKQALRDRIGMIEKQADNVPEEHKKQLQNMLRRMNSMVDGTINLAVVVRQVRLNEGQPAIFQ